MMRLGVVAPWSYIGQWDVRLGASGYAVMIGDAMVRSGNMEGAITLMHENTLQLLKTRSKRKQLRSGFLGKPATAYQTVEQEQRLQVITRIMTALEPHGIRPFLAFGTLLGKEREGSFMAHDGDLDMGILTTEGDAAHVRPLLENVGFEVVVAEGSQWPCRLKLQCKEKVPIDLVFFHPEGQHLLTYGSVMGHRLIRRRTMFGLKEDVFLNTRVWVPDPASLFLDENYGVWQQPVDFYHHIISSRLTDHTQTVVRYCALRVLYRHLSLGDYRRTSALIRFMVEKGHDSELWGGISTAYDRFMSK
jgi:hypothetical protein